MQTPRGPRGRYRRHLNCLTFRNVYVPLERAVFAHLTVVQNLELGAALEMAERVYVLRSGTVVAQHTGDETRAREDWWTVF